MRKLSVAEIVPNATYQAHRDAWRRDIIAYKRARRVQLGPLVSIVFENRRTLWFQTQEMLRAEHIEDPRLVAEEVAVYNELLPDGLSLAATLFIEIPDSSQIEAVLKRLTGVEEHVTFAVGDWSVRAEAEPGRSREDKTSSVHYLTIPLGEVGAEALRARRDAARVEVHHRDYHAVTPLAPETVASLLEDLDEAEA
jgi:hypothetical protein